MKSIRQFRSSAVLLALGTAGFANANLLMNPSFEGAGVPGWVNWGSANSYMNVYHNSGGNGYSHPSDFGNFVGVTAFDGDQFVAALGGQNGTGYISQILSSPLDAGTEYTVEVMMHQSTRVDLDHPSTLMVILSPTPTDFTGFVQVGTFSPTQSSTEGWVSRSFNFVAPSTAASLPTIHFMASVVQGQPNTYAGFDNVQLTAVPEPASIAALASGVALLLRRRRKN